MRNILSTKNIDELKQKALQAQNRIAELFIRDIIKVSQDYNAWGQFLGNTPHEKQFGIYGTCAGIIITTLDKRDNSVNVIKSREYILKLTSGDLKSTGIKEYDDDLNVIYKIAAINDSLNISKNAIEIDDDLCNSIIRRKIKSAGWGNYYFETNTDDNSNIVATSIALLTLAKYQMFKGSTSAKEAMRWLCNRIKRNGSLRLYEYGLAGMALSYYSIEEDLKEDINAAMNICVNKILGSQDNKRMNYEHFTEQHFYIVNNSGKTSNRYMFYLSHCVNTIFLLRKGGDRRVNRYVIKVIKYFIDDILNNNAFINPNNNQISSVDHLWIYRMLEEFKRVAPDQLSLKYYEMFERDRIGNMWIHLLISLISTSVLIFIAQSKLLRNDIGLTFIVSSLGILACGTWFIHSIKRLLGYN